MEPLATLTPAGVVIRFASVALAIISKARDHSSANGATQATDLQSAYEELQQRNSDLESASESDLEVPSRLKDELATIKKIAGASAVDCQRLRGVIRSLRQSGETGGSQQGSKTGLKRSRKSNELERLEETLQRTQAAITLQTCKVMNYWLADFRHEVRQLQLDTKRLQCRKSGRVSNLSSLLRKMETFVTTAQRDPLLKAIGVEDISLFEERRSESVRLKLEIKRDHLVLKSLAFENHATRQSSIPEAHRQTFEWTFSQSETNESPSSAFPNWLEQGDGVFWISGIPGCGKSTFMKFIAGDERTQAALSKWSSPKEATVISHYFWCAGTQMQRSQQGLLQALLFEILRQFPDFIEPLCQDRWAGYESASTSTSWTVAELHQAIYAIVSREDLPAKLCFFIDGLDEYEGDQLALCHELKALSRTGNVKLCVSSRPWSVFMEAFGAINSNHIRLQDLTRRDIQNFVKHRLDEPGWSVQLDEKQSDWVVAEISKRAQGVFLWVSLVMKLLREQVTRDDAFEELCARFKDLPTDLDDFFTYLLENVEISEQSKMATSLLVALAADKPLDISIYHFHHLEYEDLDYVLNIPLNLPGKLEQRKQRSRTASRLNALCGGLLETDETVSSVNFLHRTVRDYLDLQSTQTMLNKKTTDGFCVELSLLKAFAAWIKTSKASTSEEPKVEFVSNIRSLGTYASRLDAQTNNGHNKICHRLLDEVDLSLTERGPPAEESHYLLRDEVIGQNLASYLSDIIPRQPNYFSSLPIPALVIALFPEYSVSDSRPRPSHWNNTTTATLECLFRCGANPNEPFSSSEALASKVEKTPWTVLCEHAIPHYQESTNLRSTRRTQSLYKFAMEQGIFKAFLDNGAERNAKCERPGTQPSTVSLDYLFNSFRLAGDEALETLYLDHLESFFDGKLDIAFWYPVLELFYRRMDSILGPEQTPPDDSFLGNVREYITSLCMRAYS